MLWCVWSLWCKFSSWLQRTCNLLESIGTYRVIMVFATKWNDEMDGVLWKPCIATSGSKTDNAVLKITFKS
jgi:hypothetical protein